MSGNAVAFARLTKIDEAQRLVYGRITQEVVDNSGEILDYEASKPNFEKWSSSVYKASGGKSVCNVRAMHGPVAAGRGDDLIFHDDEKAIDICAKIVDDGEWKKCLEGVYTGFSIGGSYVRKWKDADGNKRYEANPKEVSLVDMPCVPTATFFEVQKSDGSLQKVDFIRKPEPPTIDDEKKQAIEKRARELCKADGMDPDGKHRTSDGTEVPMWHQFQKAAIDALNKVDEQKPDPASDPASDAKPEDKKPDEPVAKKDEPAPSVPEVEVVGTDQDVQDFGKFLNDNKITLADALVLVKRAVDKKAPCFIIKKFADTELRKYPLDNEPQIRAAWDYVNRGMHKYDDAKLEVVKGEIVAAWKEHIDAAGPGEVKEEAKKAYETGDLRKNLYLCADFAYMLQSLSNIINSAEYEAYVEGDQSPIPGRLKACLLELGSVLSDMIAEEVNEEYLNQPQISDVRGNIIALSDGVKDLVKRLTPPKKDEPTDLLKLNGEPLKKLLADAISVAVTPLQKANDTLQAQLTKMTEELAVIKSTPQAPKAILRGGSIKKSDDLVTDHDNKQEISESALVKDARGEVHPAASVFKALHKLGGAPVYKG